MINEISGVKATSYELLNSKFQHLLKILGTMEASMEKEVENS